MDADELDVVVRQVQAGDATAYDRIVTELSREVASFVAARATSLTLIDEVVQTAFVGAYEQISAYEPRGTFAAWVKGFARNALHKQLSERTRLVSSDVEALESLLAKRAIERLADDSRDSWELAAGRHLPQCLQRLPPQTREIALRRFAQDVPLNVLAQQFKRTRASVACLLTRVRQALQECIEAQLQADGRSAHE
jgi:RNA polymerase sigma-70 factor (ECF subfamily)